MAKVSRTSVAVAKRIWSKTVTKVLAIAGFVAAFAVFISNLKSIKDDTSDLLDGSKGLQIVDVSFLKDEQGESFPDGDHHYAADDTLDVKLRNNGKEVAFAKAIIIKVKKGWKFKTLPDLSISSKEASKTYLMRLPLEIDKIPYEVSQSISHEIKPGETDRIFLALRSTYDRDYTFVYNVDLEIVFDEDNKRIKKGNVMLGFQFPSQIFYKLDDYKNVNQTLNLIYEAHLKSLNEIKRIEGIKSGAVLQIMKTIEEGNANAHWK